MASVNRDSNMCYDPLHHEAEYLSSLAITSHTSQLQVILEKEYSLFLPCPHSSSPLEHRAPICALNNENKEVTHFRPD